MQNKLYKQLHTNVFHEIIKGKYNPCLSHNNDAEILKNFVFQANTIKVATLPAENDPLDFIENFDFTIFGYYSNEDVMPDSVKRPSGQHDIIIKPGKQYDLNEPIDLPAFVNPKCNHYVGFMGDEFERIKIRAEKVYVSGTKESGVKEYASKHVQMLKKLFYEAKLLLKKVQTDGKAEDIYIVFAANLFIIRIILFYQKFFRIYLPASPDAEEILFNEVLKELSLRKLCSLFPCEKHGYGEYLKKTYLEKQGQRESHASEVNEVPAESFFEKKTLPVQERPAKYQPIKMNGQVNVFVDIFVQLLENCETPDGPMIETTRENLEKFLTANFLDKNGKPLNPFTVNTILKPYRTDKHISPDSEKRVDVEKMVNRKNEKK